MEEGQEHCAAALPRLELLVPKAEHFGLEVRQGAGAGAGPAGYKVSSKTFLYTLYSSRETQSVVPLARLEELCSPLVAFASRSSIRRVVRQGRAHR